MPQKIDLHLHTLDDPRDHHVRHTAEELIDAAARRHYTALAITLHTRQWESERHRRYAADRGILLIPGVEQDVEGRHVLLLNFARDDAHAVHTFADLRRLKAAQRRPVLVAAAHPFYPDAVCLKERLFEQHDLFDAIEVTGFHHRWWNPNLRARAAAERLGLPLIGNSDTHTLEQFGTLWTEVAAEPNVESILAALKQGRGRVCGRPLGLREMGVIAYKVIAQGYMPWVDYKKRRGHVPAE